MTTPKEWHTQAMSDERAKLMYSHVMDAIAPPRGAHVQKTQQIIDEGTGRGLPEDRQTHAQRMERARLLALHKRLVPEYKAEGAESKYQAEWMPKMVYDMLCDAELINTKKTIAAHLNVHESTFRRWQSIYPELGAAVARGIAMQEAWLATQMAGGMKYSASMYAVLKNLHEWKETVENTHKLSPAEALQLQASGAKRVDWDRTRPDPLASKRTQVIDAQTVDTVATVPSVPVSATPDTVATVASTPTPLSTPTDSQIPTPSISTVPSDAGGSAASSEAIE